MFFLPFLITSPTAVTVATVALSARPSTVPMPEPVPSAITSEIEAVASNPASSIFDPANPETVPNAEVSSIPDTVAVGDWMPLAVTL